MAAGSNRAVLIDTSTDEVLKSFEVKDGFVSLSLSPDGKLLGAASGGKDHSGNVALWDLATGSQVGKLEGHGSPVTGMSWSPDSRRVLTWEGRSYFVDTHAVDHAARVWDVGSRQVLQELPFQDRDLLAGWFTPDGNYIVLVDPEGGIQTIGAIKYGFWRVKSLGRSLSDAKVAAISVDGKRVLVLCLEANVGMWDLETNTLKVFPPMELDASEAMAFFIDETPMLWNWKGGFEPRILRVNTN